MNFDRDKASAFLDAGKPFDRDKATAFLEGKTGIETADKIDPVNAPDRELPSSLQVPGGHPDDIESALLEQQGVAPAPNAPAPEPRSTWQQLGDVPSEFNREIVGLLGIPGDVWNLTAEAFEAKDLMGPGWGSEQAKALAGDLGIAYKGDPADSVGATIGGYAAMGLTFLAPMLRAGAGAATALPRGQTTTALSRTRAPKPGQNLQKVTGVMEGVAQRIAAPFFAQPKVALAGELAGSVGAGIGAYYGGREFGPTGEMIFGMAGGFAPQTSLILGPRLKDLALKQIFSFTEPGAKMKAGQRLRSLAETERVAENVVKEQRRILPGAKIPPAKLAGDRHILALHYKLLEGDPPLEYQLRMETTRINAMARDEMESLGGNVPIEQTQAYVQGRLDHIKTLLNKNMDKQLQRATQSLENLSPGMKRKTVNSNVNRLVNNAYDDAKTIERGEWANVKKSIMTETDSLRVAYGEELLNRSQAQAVRKEDIPDYVEEFLGAIKDGQFRPGKYRKKESIIELQTFRSRLLDDVRAERASESPNRNKIRILGDLQEATLNDMGRVEDTGVQQAIQISRLNAEKFKGGIMDVIFGHSRSGGKVAPELAIESLTPGTVKGGPKAAVEFKKILTAAPESAEYLENLVKLQIASSSVMTSKQRINVPSAKRYMKNNEEIMELFPQLKQDMNHAIGLEERAIGTVTTTKQRLKDLSQSTAARLAGIKPGQVLPEILSSPYPDQAMKKFIGQANATGKRGIRGDVIDYLFERATTGKLDESNRPLLSGEQLVAEWNKNKSIFKQAFNRDETRRLLVVINTLLKNQGLRDLPTIGQAVPPTNKLMSFIVGLSGTKVGAWLAGKSTGAELKAAATGSKIGSDFAEKLDTGLQRRILKDAIQDPVLFNALMADTTKPPQMMKANKVIQAWMLGVAIDTLDTINTP